MAASEIFWEELLDLVEEGRVVPVVGQDLLTIPDKGAHLYPWLAGRLAEILGVPGEDLPAGGELNAVTCRFLDGRQPEEVRHVYRELKRILTGSDLGIPEPLLRLAGIRHFPLLVTTTFDPLLERAVNEIRYGARETAQVLSFSIRERPQDLSSGLGELERSVVYHLFGRLSAVATYAVTDEDVLEFVHALQSEAGQKPARLFEELEHRSLLILGCSFGRWLARFFLRTAQRRRLSATDRPHFVADDRVRGDESQVVFLRHFAKSTEVYDAGAVEFVAELHRRWSERYPPSAGESESPAAAPAGPGAVFLSYASEDREAASRLCRALEKRGVDVFFDKKDLRAGDDWDKKLRRAVRECSVFVPVISRNTLGGSGGRRFRYFRVEWNEACALRKLTAPGTRFIVPVVLDDTSRSNDELPEEFRAVQWGEASGGQPSPELLDAIRELFDKHHGVPA